MKTSLRLFLSLLLICLLPGHALAWADKAHRIIASLAWLQLSPEAQKKVQELLGATTGRDPLMSVATWADEQRPKNKEEREWHFVDIPLDADSYSQERDCRDLNCLVEKTNYFKNILEFDKVKSRRVEALKYLVHLMGDLHQPLHCTDNYDSGGNRVQVTFFGKLTNLHKVWDLDLIDRTGLSEESYIKKLQKISLPKGGWMADWANESHMIARAYAYHIPGDKDLGNTYYRTNLPILDLQLARAGARLAWVLEGAFGTGR